MVLLTIIKLTLPGITLLCIVGWAFWVAGWSLGWGAEGKFCYEFYTHHFAIAAVSALITPIFFRNVYGLSAVLGVGLAGLPAVMTFWFVLGAGTRLTELERSGHIAHIDYPDYHTCALHYVEPPGGVVSIQVGTGRGMPRCVLVKAGSPLDERFVYHIGWIPGSQNSVKSKHLELRWYFPGDGD